MLPGVSWRLISGRSLSTTQLASKSSLKCCCHSRLLLVTDFTLMLSWLFCETFPQCFKQFEIQQWVTGELIRNQLIKYFYHMKYLVSTIFDESFKFRSLWRLFGTNIVSSYFWNRTKYYHMKTKWELNDSLPRNKMHPCLLRAGAIWRFQLWNGWKIQIQWGRDALHPPVLGKNDCSDFILSLIAGGADSEDSVGKYQFTCH